MGEVASDPCHSVLGTVAHHPLGTPSLLLSHGVISDPAASTRYWTTQCDGEVQLRIGKNRENEPPITVPDMIMSAATKYAHYLAIGFKYNNSWQFLTYAEYYEVCRRAAKAFLKVLLLRTRKCATPLS